MTEPARPTPASALARHDRVSARSTISRSQARRVLVRVDLNVPMREGAVGDTTRIDRVAPTLKELSERGAKVVVASHFGRPKGKPVLAMSLGPLTEPLAQALGGLPVRFVADCIGAGAEATAAALAPGDVALLENLRFHAGEEGNDPAFADALARLADLYVNDAFSAAHRAHASTTAVAERLPNAAGRLMQAELEALGKALQAPARPVIAVVGGAKVSTKLAVLANLIRRVDRLVIGGAMANTFLHARGVAVGASLHEPDLAEDARRIVAEAESRGLQDRAAHRRGGDAGAQGGRRERNGPDRPSPGGRHDPRPRARDLRAHRGGAQGLAHAGVERPPGRLRDRALRPCDHDVRARGPRASPGRARFSPSPAAATRWRHCKARACVAPSATCPTAGGAFLEWLEGRTLPGVAALEVGGQ